MASGELGAFQASKSRFHFIESPSLTYSCPLGMLYQAAGATRYHWPPLVENLFCWIIWDVRWTSSLPSASGDSVGLACLKLLSAPRHFQSEPLSWHMGEDSVSKTSQYISRTASQPVCPSLIKYCHFWLMAVQEEEMGRWGRNYCGAW